MPKQTSIGAAKATQSANNFDRLFGAAKGQSKTGGLLLIDRNRIQTAAQPRQSFSNKELRDLADSIRTLREKGEGVEGTGILQPLLVAADEDGNYRLIAGERRLRAASEAGLKQVPAVVVPTRANQVLTIQLIENLQRADLPPLDEARALGRLIEEQGLSIRDAARALGKERGWVQNRVRLLKVADDVRAMVEQRPDSIPHAFEIEGVIDLDLRATLIQETLDGASATRIRQFIAEKTVSSQHDAREPDKANVSFQNDRQANDIGVGVGTAKSSGEGQPNAIISALEPANAFAAEAARLLKKAKLTPDHRAEVQVQLDSLERTVTQLRKLIK